MGVYYSIVNWTRKERVELSTISGIKDAEIALSPASSAISVWYMIKHCADHVAFVGDENGIWPFPDGSIEDTSSYQDVTDEVINELIAEHILIDEGREVLVEADDELGNPVIYQRYLRVNGWMKGNWIPDDAGRPPLNHEHSEQLSHDSK